jgi:hypothetical protein
MRRLLIPLLITAVPLAACGGGSSTAAKTVTPAAATSTVASGHFGATATTASTKALSFSGNSRSSWCDLDRSLQNSAQFQNSLKDPRAWASQLDSVISKVEAKAPGPIKSDVQTLIAGLRVLEKALADANYDFAKVNPAHMSGLNSPSLTAASDRIIAYDKQVCGTKS